MGWQTRPHRRRVALLREWGWNLSGSALASNGDGTFRVGGIVGTFAMEIPVLTADFNNDGIPDVLLKEVSGIQFAVALGKDHGTFGSSMIIVTSTETGTIQGPVIAGDFNGDGKPDIAAIRIVAPISTCCRATAMGSSAPQS